MSDHHPIILFGASGHGKVVADILSSIGTYTIIGFCDDGYSTMGKQFYSYPLLGGRAEVLDYVRKNPATRVLVSIGNNHIRSLLIEWLDENNIQLAPAAVHPSAQIGQKVTLGDGLVVMARAVINSSSTIGRGGIINTCASVDHDCTLGDCIHIAPGAHLCGLVTMGNRSMLGAGGVVIPSVVVGNDVMVGAGATVVREVPDGVTVVGVPASIVHDPTPTHDTPPAPIQAKPWLRQSPKQFNTLFTCAGRRVELIRGFRAAMNLLGVAGEIHVAEHAPHSAAGMEADHYITMPRVRSKEYIPALIEAIKTHEIDLVIPLTDLDIRSLARQQKQFHDIGCTVAVGSSGIVNTCRNKFLFAEYLDKRGIPVIPTQELAAFQANPYYPCFAKPLSGSSSIGASKIETPAQLLRHVEAYGEELILQPFIEGQEFTIDIYKSRAGDVKAIVPRQRLRVRAGEIEQGITVDDPDLLAATRQLAEALEGLWGVFCAQCRRTPDGQILFYEVNPRFGGGAPQSIAAGANIPLYLLEDIMGLEITTDGSFQADLLMMRYPAAFFKTTHQPSALDGYNGPISR